MTSKPLPPTVVWPDSWRNVPLWALFDRVKDVGHPGELMLSVYREYGVVVKDSRTDNNNQTAENREIYQLVHPGWFVANRMKAWQGSVGISKHRGIVSGHYICFRPKHHEVPRYLNWLLRSDVYACEYLSMSRGVRPGQVEIDNDELRGLRIALPSLGEQESISRYLDIEVARIDRLATMNQRALDLADERVNARIRQVIGRSELASSFGEKLAPLRRFLEKLDRPPSVDGETVTVFRDGQVVARRLRRAEGYTDSTAAGPQGQGVEIGDVVVHGLDGFAGAIGDSESSGNCSLVYHVCRAIGGEDSAFFGRLLRVLALDGYLSLFGASARERAVDFRNWERFGGVLVPGASADEQGEIGDAIRALRPLRDEVRRLMKLLAERRQALITAAVTGQIDVSTARRVAV